jgi:alginate O-acetyltransferase complex protein AlgI
VSTSSPQYLAFLAAVVLLLPMLPRGGPRIAAIAIVSCAWYAIFERSHLAMLALISATAWVGGVVVERMRGDQSKRAAFTVALGLTLMPLFAFKYVVPATGGAASGWTLAAAALPVGISFYSFQAAAYLIDVFIGVQPAEPRFWRFAAFMSFFPQLTAGPISRGRQLLPQLPHLGEFDAVRAVAGARALLLGFFMKVVIADSIAPVVEDVYSQGAAASATDLLLGTIYFSFQVYADFAGYSLMAIGAGRLLGVELPQNFAQPYLSQSLTEYWRTWHMTLSAWVRDYILTPLQLSWRRSGNIGLAAAIVVTFVVVGVWHGGAWKFFWFGLIHGVLVMVATLTARRRSRFWLRSGVPQHALAIARVLGTFSVVTLTFVLFRSAGTAEAVAIYRRLMTGPYPPSALPLLWPGLAIAVLITGDLLARRNFTPDRLPAAARWTLYHAAASTGLAVFLWRYLSGNPVANQFIYYKF